ncbi:MAG: 16S rRNA (guanine(527)-N(7))-methyltransferase RsmG [Christensenella sp.]|uniref:16S rRNA (guanine(527)-N(7))-methyltransferase RsmG n=1 Tax=Christensenella sp. TaxID=1935934 RepID=UPI002B2195FD|nr:16S rRNA (guanine(527)-N(7))-methyltransferase RsmG [Christensenella sp.]MEA5003950.1 16S rRNA (guanine(527)-N(7))-methyltransferase RsmG [Christensenella sp.]
MSVFSEELNTLCTQNGYEVSKDALQSMELYYDCMVETNKQYNLTAITAPKDAALKHFFDSIVPCALLPKNGRVVDVGSGAGFPIAPLKAVRKDIRAFAVESSKKKCDFIVEASRQASLDVTVFCERAEVIAAGKPRESFDACVSRAVAPLRVLCELCAPLLKNGGLFFAYKGEYEEELAQAKKALVVLNLQLVEKLRMPHEEYAHHILVFRKTGENAAKYPRRYAQIVKSPL